MKSEYCTIIPMSIHMGHFPVWSGCPLSVYLLGQYAFARLHHADSDAERLGSASLCPDISSVLIVGLMQ